MLIIHLLLLFWSVGGFLEMILPQVFWEPFANPEFPDWLLAFHWGSILFASMGFIYGYFTQWNKTPQLMTAAYLLMALVCLIETFGFMTSSSKYTAMILEFTVYIAILSVLYKSEYFNKHFQS